MTHAPAPPARRAGLSALKTVFMDPRYRALFAASAAAMASHWMLRIALGWLLWEATESAVWLGALAIAELAPGLLLGPAGGVLADRMDRRRLVIVCQGVVVLQAIAAGVIVLAGVAEPILLVALAALGGSAAATQESARSLLQKDVTPPDCIPTGMSATAVSVNVTRFLGPALAGPLMQWPGPASVFWINGLVALAVIVVVAGLKPPERMSTSGKNATFALDLWRGAVAAATHPTVTPVLAVFAATALIIRPLYELMPAFADRLFGGGVQDYSFLVMSVGVGAVVGALVVTLNAPARPARMFMASSVGACGALAAFGLAQGMVSAMIAAGVLGFFMCISATSSQLVVLLDAAEETSGRVLSLWSTLMRGGPALGALAMGAALDLLGYRWPLFISAALCASLIALVLLDGRRRAPAAAIARPERPATSET